MTNEQKSKVIHEALFPDVCWHEWEHQTNTLGCRKCPVRRGFWAFMSTEADNPNYFAHDLPDNVRVRMVTVAFERFGMLSLMVAADVIDGQKLLMKPTAVIAEAIYQLITESSNSNE